MIITGDVADSINPGRNRCWKSCVEIAQTQIRRVQYYTIRVFIVSITADIGNIEFNQDYRVKCSLIKVRVTALLKIYRRYYLITAQRTLRRFYCIARRVIEIQLFEYSVVWTPVNWISVLLNSSRKLYDRLLNNSVTMLRPSYYAYCTWNFANNMQDYLA